MNGTPELFYRQLPLLERSYRVVTYALRDDAGSIDALASDLAMIVESAAPADQRAIIIGESFGGTVALTFALRYPERVEALTILNSFAHFTPQVRLRMALVGLRLLPWGAMSLVRHLTAFRLHSSHTHRAEIRRFIALTGNAGRPGYINRLRLLKRFDVRDRLCDIRCPVLLLAAEEDHLVPSLEQAKFMAARFPGTPISCGRCCSIS
jgi:pimeloyl-ACP methyl ester carboxylesterase